MKLSFNNYKHHCKYIIITNKFSNTIDNGGEMFINKLAQFWNYFVSSVMYIVINRHFGSKHLIVCSSLTVSTYNNFNEVFLH